MWAVLKGNFAFPEIGTEPFLEMGLGYSRRF
jgi:hypothetical protein